MYLDRETRTEIGALINTIEVCYIMMEKPETLKHTTFGHWQRNLQEAKKELKEKFGIVPA